MKHQERLAGMLLDSPGMVNAADVTVVLSPLKLARDLNRDATPQFRVTMVQELLRLDDALAAEVRELLR